MYVSLFFSGAWKKVLLWVTAASLLATLSPLLNESGLFMKYWPAFVLGALLRAAHKRGWTPAAFGARELAVSVLATACLLAGVLVIIFAPPCGTPFACSTVPNLTFTLASAYAAISLWFLGGIEHGVSAARTGHRRWLLPFFWLGQSSYSLYLIHGKIYQLPEMVVRQLIAPASLLYPALTMGGTACLCYLFYLAAEKPFHAYAKSAYVTPAAALPLAAKS